MTELRHSLRAALATFSLAALLVALLAAAEPVRAEPADGEPLSEAAPEEVLTLEEAARLLRIDPEELADLATRQRIPGRRIGAEWRFSRATLRSWLAGVGSWEAEPPREHEMASTVGRGPGGSDDESDDEETVVGEEPAYETAADVFLRNQRVLLNRGELIVEPGLFYMREDYPALKRVEVRFPDYEQLNVWIDDITNVERDTLTAALVARYGVFKETELFGGIVYEYQRISYDFTDYTDRDTDDVVEILLGARRTLIHERRRVPDVVLSVNGRIPILHSSYALRGDLWVLKSFDPVVLLAGLQYERVFSRDFDNVNRLEPENTLGLKLGYAFAVNDDLTLSTTVYGWFVGGTEFSKVTLKRHEEYNLRLAVTGRMGKGRYVEPSVSFGLNGPGTRVMFGLSFPFLVNP
jgi:excisionase family DNA binding protein